ncbi:MAG: 16S rRNA (cytosine(967)-C(5))-methyltransferase RsmB [Desulfuromonas sp.]|nr:MAG: 16S rRNA (cytosine(967)-C(5))-methyltransferase RsmB [Desulfuromonas sp.]
MSDARQGAYEILQQVEQGGYSDLVLDRWLSQHPALDIRDKALLTELVYGVLRLRGRIDFALEKFCNQPLERLEPAALRLLRIGTYQLLELDRVPERAAVHATVELARRSGMERLVGLVNGVLRSLAREAASIEWPSRDKPRPYMQHVCSLPGWITKEMMRLLPNIEAVALAENMAQQPPLSLRVNSLKTSRDQFLKALEMAGHEARPCKYAAAGVVVEKRGEEPLPGNREGWYQVEDEASMLVTELLDPQPGERILDACAAPGGKTTHIAMATENQSEITALDLHEHRVGLIEQGARRLGCKNIDARQWDMTAVPDFVAAERFDRILVDAPCSGLGVLRRNPESRWTRKAVDIKKLARLQLAILERAAPLVKPGGSLVYSLCTFTSRETEDVVQAFLEEQKGFVRENPTGSVPAVWADLLTEEGALRSWPHRHDGMDAFYAVRFRKNGS